MFTSHAKRFLKASSALVLVGVLAACGAAEEKANEVANTFNIKGHWLMTESEHSSEIEKAVEDESMVLSFADGKMAFAPTDSVKGKALFTVLSHCTVGPRPYKLDGKKLILEEVTGCEKVDVEIETVDRDTLKFPDPYKEDVVRTFTRIDEEEYHSLVKKSDRNL